MTHSGFWVWAGWFGGGFRRCRAEAAPTSQLQSAKHGDQVFHQRMRLFWGHEVMFDGMPALSVADVSVVVSRV